MTLDELRANGIKDLEPSGDAWIRIAEVQGRPAQVLYRFTDGQLSEVQIGFTGADPAQSRKDFNALAAFLKLRLGNPDDDIDDRRGPELAAGAYATAYVGGNLLSTASAFSDEPVPPPEEDERMERLAQQVIADSYHVALRWELRETTATLERTPRSQGCFLELRLTRHPTDTGLRPMPFGVLSLDIRSQRSAVATPAEAMPSP